MNDPVKQWAVRPPLIVRAPGPVTDWDDVEIRVSVTPSRWVPGGREYGEQFGVQSSVVVIEAKDQRAMAYIIRQMIDQLLRAWFDGEKA